MGLQTCETPVRLRMQPPELKVKPELDEQSGSPGSPGFRLQGLGFRVAGFGQLTTWTLNPKPKTLDRQENSRPQPLKPSGREDLQRQRRRPTLFELTVQETLNPKPSQKARVAKLSKALELQVHSLGLRVPGADLNSKCWL